LSRIRDILEYGLSNPNSPMAKPYFSGINHCETSAVDIDVRHSFLDQINKVHKQYCDSNSSSICDLESSYIEAKASYVATTPSQNRV
jgi:hypothetical protein